MHPEIIRELTAQRGREMQARAGQARLARMAIRVGRRRNRPGEADGFVPPAIPDYVDGAFGTAPVGEGGGQRSDQAAATRHAA